MPALLVSLVVTIALVGCVVWVVVTYVPMPEPFRRILVAVVVLALLVWLIQVASGLSLPPGWR